ncbi:MAG: sugar transferase [Deltaproteobacteria bacterium]|uniref:Sugar transferase n=1 Tax=Candidatus Zymogenus saltonus TaxID=2844893 RepID=A0A9D8PP08_9DELT|nr:sugar transferase [Candidatus Zymogenus saltonus]
MKQTRDSGDKSGGKGPKKGAGESSRLVSPLTKRKRWARKILIFFLVLMDAAFLTISWFSAYWLRYYLAFYFPKTINAFSVYLYSTPIMVTGWVVTCAFFGLYRRTSKLSVITEFNLLVKASLLGLLVSMSLSFLFKNLDFGRSVVIFMFGFSLLFLSISRVIIRFVEERMWERGIGIVRTLVVGAGESGIRAVQKLQDSREVGYRVVGFVDKDEKKWGKKVSGIPVLGGEDDIMDIVVEHDIDDVFFALPNINHHKILDIISSCTKGGVYFHIVTDIFDVISDGTVIDMLGDFPVVDLKGEGPTWGYSIIKRAMDIFISIFGIVFTTPIWLIIMALIKIDSKGPILFKQRRVGLNGREFNIMKFRTMQTEAATYARSPKSAVDDRITRIGKFLRKFSLDELPQLINVIAGDMSIVGPRPEMPFIVEKYKEWEKKRLVVKPGLTGLWQVIGRKDLPLEENIQYDFFYIKNRSLVMDLSIIMRTFPALLSRRGAY